MPRDTSCDCCPVSLSPMNMVEGNKKNHKITPSNLVSTMRAIEERSCDLAARRQYLNDKIFQMEKTMPLLIAYNAWSGATSDPAIVINKIRDIVDKVSPYTHSELTDSTIKATNDQVNILKTKTTELHEQIIEADIKIEEFEMTLESLQVVINEMNDKLKTIETNHTKRDDAPHATTTTTTATNFNTITTQDLNCLSKLRQLMQQEIRLKQCIDNLEHREKCIREQLECLLQGSDDKTGEIVGKKRLPSRIVKSKCPCVSKLTEDDFSDDD